jgi:hypothetical protein
VNDCFIESYELVQQPHASTLHIAEGRRVRHRPTGGVRRFAGYQSVRV